MKYLVALLFLLNITAAIAQTVGDAVTDKKYTVRERYGIIREKSQTFKEYKVIKETILDSFWKIITDSMAAQKARLQTANGTIATLQKDLSSSQAALKEKEQSTQDIVFASTHISIAGIDFTKSGFASFVGIVILALIVCAGLLVAKLKLMYGSVRERNDTVNSITREYEDYKHKAMDKQTKLSRELQNERNKLQELRAASR